MAILNPPIWPLSRRSPHQDHNARLHLTHVRKSHASLCRRPTFPITRGSFVLRCPRRTSSWVYPWESTFSCTPPLVTSYAYEPTLQQVVWTKWGSLTFLSRCTSKACTPSTQMEDSCPNIWILSPLGLCWT